MGCGASAGRGGGVGGDGEELHLEYHMFDWDDNVMIMPTQIWMQDKSSGEILSFSTAEFAIRRGDPGLGPVNGDFEESFREFRDGEGGGDFEGDLKRALSGPAEDWQGPALGDFRQALIDGKLFAIVTARGHSEEILRRSITGFINTLLSAKERREMISNLQRFNRLTMNTSVSDEVALENYLQRCSFIGVSHPEFRSAHPGATSTDERKAAAIRSFVSRIVTSNKEIFSHCSTQMASTTFTFSDDDPKNIATVEKLMRDDLSKDYPGVAWKLLDTGGKARREIDILNLGG
eukprot:TRINITY_DN54529_c0_g1_i1.p1 TRINITY_DN54529_c0_g1~~TRINITY_DN54529_c0_g1_i1.p1  ORF type:complete len:291 (-),score=56.52 TRINITY_DN54529_c0_g1_i1:65-937(-)